MRKETSLINTAGFLLQSYHYLRIFLVFRPLHTLFETLTSFLWKSLLIYKIVKKELQLWYVRTIFRCLMRFQLQCARASTAFWAPNTGQKTRFFLHSVLYWGGRKTTTTVYRHTWLINLSHIKKRHVCWMRNKEQPDLFFDTLNGGGELKCRQSGSNLI